MNSKIILTVLALTGGAAVGYWLGAQPGSQTPTPSAAKVERKVLYYRNPMGLPDTSPTPKKDAMGMDYVAVYEGDEQSTGSVSISTDKVQRLGVKSVAATRQVLDQRLRASGRIEIDERHTYTIAPKFEGWVERLYVNTTGQLVAKGQPLFEVYSPELISGLREQSLARQGVAALKDADGEARDSMRRLAEASATRLRNWDIAETQLNQDRVVYRAPVNGVVLEKRAVQGMRFVPGEVLYQIADLSSVWVIADVPEREVAAIKLGGAAQVNIESYPKESFDGKVDFIYPAMNSVTRTVPVRIVIANPQGVLKPSMFAQVELATGRHDEVLTVPASAVIDSGTRQIVLVQLAAGRFEPREVKLGSRNDQYIEVLAGVAEGEQVVVAANFLIDAESNLRAALSGMGDRPTSGGTVAALVEKPTSLRTDHAEHSVVTKPEKTPRSVGHQAIGTLDAINDDGTVSITHQAIASLGWPGMTMDFALANIALVKDITPGSAITFELVERTPGEWLITKLQAQHPRGAH